MRVKSPKKSPKKKSNSGTLNFIVLLVAAIFLSFFIAHFSQKTKAIEKGIFCDTEKVIDGFFEKNGHQFGGGHLQSSKYAFSGNYACAVTSKDSIGLLFEMKKAIPGEQYRVTVWRYSDYAGNFGKLVVEGTCGFRKEENVQRKTVNNWHQLELFFRVPTNIEDFCELSIFVENDHEKIDLYFDDLKIEQLAVDKNGVTFSPDVLKLDISEKATKKLERIKKEAIRRGLLVKTEESWIKGQLYSQKQDEKIKVKARYKGDWLDHFSGNKESFRIGVKGENAWNRLLTFSLQNPKTRSYLLEWIYHEWLRKEDVLTTRYDFLTFELNGKPKGVYAFEEHFEKQLPESSNRREGPIIKLNEELFWYHINQNTQQLDEGVWIPEWDESVFQNAEIRPFKESKTLGSPQLKKQFEMAQTLLSQLINQQKKASEVIDIERFAKYYAIVDILNAGHSMFWINHRFYYNPVTSKLEPIGYDGFGDKSNLSSNYFPMGYRVETRDVGSAFYKLLFKDAAFHRMYLRYLHQFSSAGYLEKLLLDLEQPLLERERFIQKDNKKYKFDANDVLKRAKRIRAIIHPFNGANLQARISEKKDRKQYLKIANQHSMGLEILGFGQTDNELTNPLPSPILLLPLPKNQVKKFDTVIADLDAKFVFFRLPGADSIFQTPILAWSPPALETPAQSLFDGIDSLISTELFLVRGKQILFKKGKYTINKDVLIPANYQVIFPAGLQLDFIKNAAFISKSPVTMLGEEDNPIVIESTDKTANGFTILEAKKRSKVHYTIFENMNTLEKDGWTLTGAVTFYESNVDFLGCSFLNNHCEDALNVVRSEFTLFQSKLSNTFADGFDADFCKGEIKDVVFTNTGNDSADFSGSIISIAKCKIIQPGDKGISVGEETQVYIESASIIGATIGVASKDFSTLDINWLSLKDCTTGFAAYQKKPEYGPAKIKVKKFHSENIKRLYQLDKGSTLDLEGKLITGE